MARLVLFWSLAGLVVAVTALFWRNGTGDLRARGRRHVFAASLGASTGVLALVASSVPGGLAPASMGPRSQLVASLASVVVGLAVNALLVRAERVPRLVLTGLSALAAVAPLAVNGFRPLTDAPRLGRITASWSWSLALWAVGAAAALRAWRLALQRQIALETARTAGDLAEHRYDAASAAVVRAVAFLASVVACGVLPVLVALIIHRVAPGLPLRDCDPDIEVRDAISPYCSVGRLQVAVLPADRALPDGGR